MQNSPTTTYPHPKENVLRFLIDFTASNQQNSPPQWSLRRSLSILNKDLSFSKSFFAKPESRAKKQIQKINRERRRISSEHKIVEGRSMPAEGRSSKVFLGIPDELDWVTLIANQVTDKFKVVLGTGLAMHFGPKWEKKDRQNSHIIIRCPTSQGVSEVSRTSEQSEQCGASERVSGASEWANGRTSDPVLQSGFLVILDHSEVGES